MVGLGADEGRNLVAKSCPFWIDDEPIATTLCCAHFPGQVSRVMSSTNQLEIMPVADGVRYGLCLNVRM